MGIIFKQMSIRKKILLYFYLIAISIIGITFFFIYTLFAEYREEEFQQRQKQKITTTLKFLVEIQDIEDRLIEAMDRLTIDDLYDEKLLIFNSEKQLIYSSIDDTQIVFSGDILKSLSPENSWIETKEDLYDVVGVCVTSSEEVYYGISKAYDYFGYSKLEFLKYALIFTLIGAALILIIIAYLFSKTITSSITTITNALKNYDFGKEFVPIQVKASKDEIAILAQRFNVLMEKMKDAFAFQKHAIQHISHELKTPIAILISNFERIEKETDLETIKVFLQNQKKDTHSLSEIINALLEISKVEGGDGLSQNPLRIDELIFDLVNEMGALYPDFQFLIAYEEAIEDESKLTVLGNFQLLKLALMNLMMNCIYYSDDQKAKIIFIPQEDCLQIDFINIGPTMGEKEEKQMFQHFYRGQNSVGKRGFGLGLVFVNRIMALHQGSIAYRHQETNANIFTITLPL